MPRRKREEVVTEPEEVVNGPEELVEEEVEAAEEVEEAELEPESAPEPEPVPVKRLKGNCATCAYFTTEKTYIECWKHGKQHPAPTCPDYIHKSKLNICPYCGEDRDKKPGK